MRPNWGGGSDVYFDMAPRVLPCLILLAAGCFAQTFEVRTAKVIAGCLEKGLCGQELEVGMESAKTSARYMRGWALCDARVSLGREGSPEQIANVQRLMTMTKSVDYITIDVEVESAGDDEAIVRTHQAFSRVLRLPDGSDRRRITTVTHREQWQKVDERWTLKSFTEHDATARWEDEKRQVQLRF